MRSWEELGLLPVRVSGQRRYPESAVVMGGGRGNTGRL
ncbi:MAG TPA: hypothetical protein VFH48_30305 [Chloroflexota bacterium]|nr:hypothetical protein [Chloroflexota bacterium]